MIQKEFKSQICTTREQSQRLLGMRLKPETADMVYCFTESYYESAQWTLMLEPPAIFNRFGTISKEEFDKLFGKDMPAWSLSRLLEMLPNEVQDTRGFGGSHHPELIKHSSGYVLSIRRHTANCLVGTHIEETPIECCISMIEWLIKHNHFNKDFLV